MHDLKLNKINLTIIYFSEFGNISQEANSILQVGAMSTFIGAIYGGVINSRSAYLEFMQNNQATTFKSHLDAKVRSFKNHKILLYTKYLVRYLFLYYLNVGILKKKLRNNILYQKD